MICSNLVCQRSFQPKRRDQVFCAPKCRMRYFQLARRIGQAVLATLAYEIREITMMRDTVKESTAEKEGSATKSQRGQEGL